MAHTPRYDAHTQHNASSPVHPPLGSGCTRRPRTAGPRGTPFRCGLGRGRKPHWSSEGRQSPALESGRNAADSGCAVHADGQSSSYAAAVPSRPAPASMPNLVRQLGHLQAVGHRADTASGALALSSSLPRLLRHACAGQPHHVPQFSESPWRSCKQSLTAAPGS